MSISCLREVARQKLPLNISDADQVDEARVLMAAGLLVALRVRIPAEDGAGTGVAMIRVLAITAAGRRLLDGAPDIPFEWRLSLRMALMERGRTAASFTTTDLAPISSDGADGRRAEAPPQDQARRFVLAVQGDSSPPG